MTGDCSLDDAEISKEGKENKTKKAVMMMMMVNMKDCEPNRDKKKGRMMVVAWRCGVSNKGNPWTYQPLDKPPEGNVSSREIPSPTVNYRLKDENNEIRD